MLVAIRSFMLPGAIDGIKYYVGYEQAIYDILLKLLYSPSIWTDAATQVNIETDHWLKRQPYK